MMEDQRKKIIIHEINYWKTNRMLPEHYCDFLLNLYTEGSSPESPAAARKRFSFLSFINVFLLALLSLSIFLFYFTELSLTLQIGLVAIFGICSIVTAWYLISKSYRKLIPLLAASLILLIVSVQLAEILYPGNTFALYAVTIGNCLLWIAAGYSWRIVSYKISGFIGIVILAITIFI